MGRESSLGRFPAVRPRQQGLCRRQHRIPYLQLQGLILCRIGVGDHMEAYHPVRQRGLLRSSGHARRQE